MSKFLTREQVVADFKVNMLPSLIKLVGKDFATLEEYWILFLDGLLKDKDISDSQRENWKLSEKELELS
jgi:hypothetical protein